MCTFQAPTSESSLSKSRAWNLLLPRSLHIIDSDLYLGFIFITPPYFICYHYKAKNIHLYELCNGKNGVPKRHKMMHNEVKFLLKSHQNWYIKEFFSQQYTGTAVYLRKPNEIFCA